MNPQIIITIIAGGMALAGTIYAARSSRRSSLLGTQLDIVKAEAMSKANIIKTQSDADTHRLDQLLAGQAKFIDNLQGQVSSNDKRIEALQLKLDVCLDQKAKE